MDGSDPFRHLPGLRDKIEPPDTSSYRRLDHAMIDRKMRAMGAPENWRRPEEEREFSRRAALDRRHDGDMWVFAYGSLMWDPGFHFAEVRSATLAGYSRRFCLKTELGRGSRDNPGLMAALDRGGECCGLTFRIETAKVDEETRVIWNREMLMHAYRPEFVALATPQGPVDALAFVIDETAPNYLPGLDLCETARRMATATGIFGSSFDYLRNIVEQFAVIGIEDEEMTQLVARVQKIAEIG